MPSVQTDPTNPNNDILNSDMDESVRRRDAERDRSRVARSHEVYAKEFRHRSEYLVGEEAERFVAQEEERKKRRRQEEERRQGKCINSDRLNDGTVMSVVEMERNGLLKR